MPDDVLPRAAVLSKYYAAALLLINGPRAAVMTVCHLIVDLTVSARVLNCMESEFGVR